MKFRGQNIELRSEYWCIFIEVIDFYAVLFFKQGDLNFTSDDLVE